MTSIIYPHILSPSEKKYNTYLYSLLLAVVISLALHIIASLMFISVNSQETNASESIVKEPPQPSPVLSATPLATKGIPVLMYHSISSIPNNSLGVPEVQFAEQMLWLYSQNYHTLSLAEFQDAILHNTAVPDKSILLTFDDGYLDNYTSAWPLLKQYNFQATFFIVTDSVGPGMMDWPHLQELIKHGCSVGSHTVNHYDLTTLSSSKLEYELSISRQTLQDKLGITVDTLCYPSGRYNEETIIRMSDLGYKLGFTTKPGNAYPGDKPYVLKRVRIPGGMTLNSFKNLFSS